ncbi:MAG: HU family DNA-binding protein [Myxococcota bacterium]|jgi:integration host factor subunit beta|nr:HU family DNA-binding protein [Myxococcota bacterium]
MTKSELIDAVTDTANIPRKRAEEVVNLIFESMKESLIAGDRIEIRGFGSFKTKHYEPYMGRNPKTGRLIEVKAKVLPVFKVGKELKNRVNDSSRNSS